MCQNREEVKKQYFAERREGGKKNQNFGATISIY